MKAIAIASVLCACSSGLYLLPAHLGPAGSSEATMRRAKAHDAFQATLLSQASALRIEAIAAAKAGDCNRVHAIEPQILALPITDIEGGYHDTVFATDPGIARCLAEPRAIVEYVQATRAQCVAARDASYTSTLAQSPRIVALASLPSCPLEVPADGNREQAWRWTVLAASAAECTAVIELDARVEEVDHEHYVQVWNRDPAITRCKAELAAYRLEREQCLRTRGAELRRAQTITDARQRGEALRAVPRCGDAR